MPDVRAPGRRTRSAAPNEVPPDPSGLAIRRRWGRVAIGVGLIVLWVWGTVALVIASSSSDEALAIAADVDRFEALERSDLQVVRVAPDSEVESIGAGQIDDIVGRVAAVDLVSGALLAPDQLLAPGEQVVDSSEALVGARLKPTELPPEGVRPGTPVQVVVRPAATAAGGGTITQSAGWLMSVGDPDASTSERSVSLVVPRSAAPAVTAAAADGRVSVVVLEG